MMRCSVAVKSRPSILACRPVPPKKLSTLLGRTSITLAELVNLKPGDILSCDFTGKVLVLAEEVPMFRGSFGLSRGQQAIKFEERVRRNPPVIDHLPVKRS